MTKRTRRPGLILTSTESTTATTTRQRRDPLPPFLFAPCAWRVKKQRFAASGYLRVFVDGYVSGSECDTDGKPWLTRVAPGDYILRGDDDACDVLSAVDFRRLVKVVRIEQ